MVSIILLRRPDRFSENCTKKLGTFGGGNGDILKIRFRFSTDELHTYICKGFKTAT